MIGALALTLAVVLVIVGLTTNSRTTPKVTAATWIPALWLLHSISKSLEYWIGGGLANPSATIAAADYSYLGGSPLDRRFLIFLMLAASIVLVSRRSRLGGILKSDKYLVWLFVYMAISVLWSDFRAVSIKRWFRAFGDLLVVLVLITEPEPFASIKKTLRDLVYITIPLSVVLIKYYRSIGVEYSYDGLMEMWVGVTSHKNDLGQLAAVSGIVLIHDLMDRSAHSRRLPNLLCLIMCLWILGGSISATSKTSLVMFFVGLGIIVSAGRTAAGWRNSSWLMQLSGAIACIPAVLLLFSKVSLVRKVIAMFGREGTLTGRTDLWEVLMGIASKSRFLGRGYGSFWIGNLGHDLWSMFAWNPGQGHNGYLDVYLELGLAGAVLLGGTILVAYRHIRNHLAVYYTDGILRLTLLTMVLLNNGSESSLLRGNVFLWTVFLALIVRYPDSDANISRPMLTSLPVPFGPQGGTFAGDGV